MGRPLNKRYFGPPTPAGNEIRVTFWNGFASVQGWIIKQTGSKKFLCTDGTYEFECMLSNKDGAVANSHPNAPEDAAIGEMTITILTDAQDAVQVEKISAHKVLADDGEMYPWTFEISNYDGEAEMDQTDFESFPVDSIVLESGIVIVRTFEMMTDGEKLYINGGTMIELATSGEFGGNGYYIDVDETRTVFTIHASLPTTDANRVNGSTFTAYTGGGTVQRSTGSAFGTP